jgi:hypothetical protein
MIGMACGNPDVSRDTLGSEPTPPGHPSVPSSHLRPDSAKFPKASEKQWYSKYHPKSGIELLINKLGEPTLTYPHVHVVHDERKNEVRVVLSKGPKNHPEKRVLPGDASGNEVNEAVNELRDKL